MSILEIKDMHKSFGKTEVLKGIDLTLNKGEVLSVIGSSGSGKTTLLRCINFLERADRGQVLLNGGVIYDGASAKLLTAAQIRKAQLNFGFVFQQFNLFPQYTVLDNVTLAPKLLAKERADFKREKRAIYAEIEAHAKALLGQAGRKG